ncbi:hypothetical protein Aperf_G00000062129 [Anoplocephala perfoliata]
MGGASSASQPWSLSNVLFLLAVIPLCLSSPGLFNFGDSNAFIELDTQPLSCSRDIQNCFSLRFDVFMDSNSSVLFTGISGSLLPSNQSENLALNGVQGEPIVLFIFTDRPYVKLMVIRLTDFQVRFDLQHAFGYFDRPWNDWHKIGVTLVKRGKSIVEITFKVDQKTNYGMFIQGGILWPDWSELKALSAKEMESERRFYFNEAFLGLPLPGTMSRYAIDSLIKYQDAIRNSIYSNAEDAGNQNKSFSGKLGSFRGAIKSFLVASECACGMQNFFVPNMIQIGSGVQISSVCDVNSLPRLEPSLPGNCSSKVPGISCGCSSYSNKLICNCPPERHCTALKKRASESMRLGLIKKEITSKGWSNEISLDKAEPKSSLRFLVENYVTYKQLDSCFGNIFFCEKPISYHFWMYIDPLALMNGSTMVMKHASHRNSPWHMQIEYNGYPLGISDPEHIMKLSVEIQAPPHYKWKIDGCESDLRATPGQWHQVTVRWEKKTLSLYLDGSLCGATGSHTLVISADIHQRLGTRRTPFLFLGDHIVEDFVFNGDGVLPQFFHFTKLSDSLGEFESAVSNISGDFYAAFHLNGRNDSPFLRLPGLDITEFKAEGKLTLEFTDQEECRSYQLPDNCGSVGSCSLEVERHGSDVTVYSQSKELSTVYDMRLCDIARGLRQQRRLSQSSGLMPHTLIRLFNRGRNELERRRLIHTTEFPTLRCGFDYKHSERNGACEPSMGFSGIYPESPEGYPETPLKGTLMVSRNRLLLRPKATNPESLCLRDLELCQYGLTISFWILFLPATKISESWPILHQIGPSGSQLTVDLFRDDGQYILDTSVKSLDTISGGEAISKLWTVTSNLEHAEESWTLVTISWSHATGLSVQLNGTLAGANRQPRKTISVWESPTQDGFWLGQRGNPEPADGIVVDNFEFIPAELNYLALVGQSISEFPLSNQGLEPCRQDTCWDGSSCYPITRGISSLGDFCRCDNPRRVCRELPAGTTVASPTTSSTSPATVPATTSTSSTTPIIAPKPLPTTLSPLPGIPPGVQIPSKTLSPISAISSTVTTLKTSSTAPRTVSSVMGKPSSSFRDNTNLTRKVPLDVSPLPQCDPPCQHGGKCIEANGKFLCDCFSTPFWGETCSREHVGWLSQFDGVFGIKPHRNVFAIYNSVQSDSTQRFIFRTPLPGGAAIAPSKRIRKSITEILPSEHMVLLSMETGIGTLGLVTVNSDLFLIIDGVKKSRRQLLPCQQSHGLTMDDTLPHVVQMEHRGAVLRVKVDGIMVYPKEVIPSSCDKWLFFSLLPTIDNRTFDEMALPKSKEPRLQNGTAVLGAWFDGESEFKGAIGGWMMDGEEMIVPSTDEPVDTPNTVYLLNRRFGLSNGDFYWIRLYSLAPVTVLSDSQVAKTPTNPTTNFRFWIIGYISLGLLLFLFLCWGCHRICRQKGNQGKRGWRNTYFPFHRIISKSTFPVSRISSADSVHPLNGKAEVFVTQTNGKCTTPTLHRLKAHTTSYEKGAGATMDKHWRARMLTLQASTRPASTIGSASLASTSVNSLYPYDETDDVEKILVTPNGDSVITLATNHGVSVKQWNAFDGSYNKEILSQPKDLSQSGYQRLIALYKSDGLLFTDGPTNAQLYPLNSETSSASVQLPSTVWGVFSFRELFLFVSAPMSGSENESFASLHFWSPSNKSLPIQCRLKIKPQWLSEGYISQDSRRLPPLLGPNRANLLLRWVSTGSEELSFSIAIDLSWISEQLSGLRKPLLVLDSHIPTSLIKHSIDLKKTVFLAEDIAVSGDSRGVLHIWHVHSGEVYRSVQSDPIPADGPLLVNLAEHDFSQLKVDSDAGPITALAATEPIPTETGTFNWFCSGDESGCVVVRRCVVSTNKQLKNVASRIHAKFRPYSRTTLAYSADTVTCARMLNRSQWRTNKPEAFLATGDSSGCIRVWLLPQCTQLGQLSASCESGLLDLALSQSNPSHTRPGQWLQVIGLVRRDRSGGSSYEHGRVVIVHLSASEENGVPNAMHSPRIRIVNKQ